MSTTTCVSTNSKKTDREVLILFLLLQPNGLKTLLAKGEESKGVAMEYRVV